MSTGQTGAGDGAGGGARVGAGGAGVGAGGAGAAGDAQSVVRAAAILEQLRLSGPLGVSDLAGELALSLATAHRLTRTLVSVGLVTQLTDRRYSLGARLIPLGLAANDLLGARARPVLAGLARDIEESANLAAAAGGGAEYVAQVAGPHSMRMFTEVGRRVPLYCTGVGKAMMSTLDDAVVLELLRERGMPAVTPTTITDPGRMLDELAGIRERGYAIDDGEMEVGVRCVAAPFMGITTMAVSVSGPSSRFTEAAADAAAPTIAAAARQLETLLAP